MNPLSNRATKQEGIFFNLNTAFAPCILLKNIEASLLPRTAG